MSDRPGAQFQDHPNMVAGRAVLPRPLADFAAYELATQCPVPTCRFRRFPVAHTAAAGPGVTVAETLDRPRCQDCGEAPEIAALSLPSVNAGVTWLALRIKADAWRPIR
jgi:hypothetical protein